MYFYQSVFFLRIVIYSLCFAHNLYRVKVDLLRRFKYLRSTPLNRKHGLFEKSSTGGIQFSQLQT